MRIFLMEFGADWFIFDNSKYKKFHEINSIEKEFVEIFMYKWVSVHNIIHYAYI